MVKNINNITSIILTIPVLALLAAFILMPEKDFSENENRYLAKLPDFTLEELLEGSYIKGLESYITDQFPLRDSFAGIKTTFQKITGTKEMSGIYLMSPESLSYGGVREPLLIEGYKEPENTERIGRILGGFKKTIEELRQEGTPGIYLTLVPTPVTIYADQLPKDAPDSASGYRGRAGITQKRTAELIYENSGITDTWAGDVLMDHRDEYIFFRTDHHWTPLGAYYGIQPFLEAAGLPILPLSQWQEAGVVEGFTGTLWSRAGDYSIAGEDIILYTHPSDSLKVSYPDKGEVSDSLFNMDFADKKDKYAIFLNSLHPLVEIENSSAITDRKLVLIKDSYANAALPFLAHYFREIHVFDTRYYRKPVSGYIGEKGDITDVLILYNLNTIDSDQGIRSIL